MEECIGVHRLEYIGLDRSISRVMASRLGERIGF